MNQYKRLKVKWNNVLNKVEGPVCMPNCVYRIKLFISCTLASSFPFAVEFYLNILIYVLYPFPRYFDLNIKSDISRKPQQGTDLLDENAGQHKFYL